MLSLQLECWCRRALAAVSACCLLASATADTFAMNNPSILYSPYTWAVNAKSAKTINAGAYFSTITSGQSIVLNTDTTGVQPPYPQFWTKVDGGPATRHVLSPGNPSFNISLCVPTCSASPKHLLQVIIKSQTETKPRWAPQSTKVEFTGIVSGGGPLVAPRARKYNVLIYGDSITEGVRTMGYEGIPDDTDRNDAVRDYSYQLYESLPIEIGIVAFGASGFTHNGSGAVPPLASSYNQLWAGEPRVFQPAPDLVIYNEGTNDRGDISADFSAVVKAVKSAGAKSQLLLLPFNLGHPEISKVVKDMADKSIVFGNTTGFYSGENGLHPFGYNHVAEIAPKVAELAWAML